MKKESYIMPAVSMALITSRKFLCGSKDPISENSYLEDYGTGSEYEDSLFD